MTSIFSMSSLRSLAIRGGSFRGDFQRIRKLTDLTNLSLQRVALHGCDEACPLDAYADALSALVSLQSLELSDMGLHDVAFAKRMPKTLTELRMPDNHIENPEPFRDPSKLQVLDITRNEIKDEKYLAHLKRKIDVVYTTSPAKPIPEEKQWGGGMRRPAS